MGSMVVGVKARDDRRPGYDVKESLSDMGIYRALGDEVNK